MPYYILDLEDDYTPPDNNTVTFPSGQTIGGEMCVRIVVRNDNESEENEVFTVSFDRLSDILAEDIRVVNNMSNVIIADCKVLI